jgi:hypothetical protein
MRSGKDLARDVIFDRAKKGALAAVGVQNRFQQKCGCAFSISSGNARDCQPFGRMSIKIRAQSGQCTASVRYLRPCHILPRDLRHRISHDGNRAGSDCTINELIAIGRFAAHGHKNISRLDLARIVLQTSNGRIAALGEDFRTIEKVEEGHCLNKWRNAPE